jgi:Tol biopolymer transport system component
LAGEAGSRTGRRSIDLLALDSAPPKVAQLVDDAQGRSVMLPSLSPDGRWLAYVSNKSGREEVYAQGYPSPTGRVRVSQDGGTHPMWTKHGDALYLVAGSAIMSSTVTTQPELGFGVPRVIVNDPLLVQGGVANKTFDVAPDGRILAIKEDDSVRSDHIVVVENWLSDVRARKAEARK